MWRWRCKKKVLKQPPGVIKKGCQIAELDVQDGMNRQLKIIGVSTVCLLAAFVVSFIAPDREMFAHIFFLCCTIGDNFVFHEICCSRIAKQ